MAWLKTQAAIALLGTSTLLVLGHGDDHMDMGETSSTPSPSPILDPNRNYDLWDKPSYVGLEAHTGLMAAHIGFMVAAWFFILPIGVMLSIARSKFALPTQFLFLLLNGFGVVVGTIYNINTPDLYENNAHHKIGWIATWIVTAQVLMSLLFVYSGRSKQEDVVQSERVAFLPASLQSFDRPFHQYRWSGDSGHGTEPPSPGSSRTMSPNRDYGYRKPETEEPEDMEEVPIADRSTRPSWFANTNIDRYLSSRVPQVMSQKLLKAAEVACEVIDRAVLILGFIALTTGIVTYTGIGRANNVFNLLAHFIKGGIFVWYGLLTLGRWLGAFADLGWAWNLKPTRSEVGWKARLPTAEFTESFVIFLYGCINVFLEHLAAWGDAWSAQDFEHVSISVMFFGGGLAGMLVESKQLRTFLNTSIDMMPTRNDVHPEQAHEIREEPKSYSTSVNIMPALVILLLGIMMSSHKQDSMVASMVHKQWGTLLSGFAVCRALTYVLTYLSPPKSIYPSRPPTELATSFCLLSGGLIFMLSTHDIVHYMDVYNLMPMFTFTVVMGFTAFVMAYTMFVVGLKGWAARREHTGLVNRY
ncbi:hypothetical protein LTS08_007212 [Lithohypha guttulata]|uniref:Integral membrane protein n=1 Tax=Lithohypha guttulata TaxID=1690604 RepID=A0AAN7T246_9EURO|nr:hypothetical protein LTR05_003967 [Lithohypha guttulata]KAK5097191.1 hypothetical protein LTS08_007212 [Lithohypha guttulata]